MEMEIHIADIVSINSFVAQVLEVMGYKDMY